ncbi:MAG: UvrB/UvrC motif-containing protein [Acutalibacteraceae bacterium]
MLCQNCNKNEANMHMKRIINGRAAEVHLCSDCARSLGYGEAFSGFGLGFSDFLGDFLLKGEHPSNSARCPFCNKSFEEIAKDGKMGCAECYSAFYDKLLPSLQRIHGKSTHMGKKPTHTKTGGDGLMILKEQLEKAVREQDFESAVRIRDEINAILSVGGEEQ